MGCAVGAGEFPRALSVSLGAMRRAASCDCVDCDGAAFPESVEGSSPAGTWALGATDEGTSCGGCAACDGTAWASCEGSELPPVVKAFGKLESGKSGLGKSPEGAEAAEGKGRSA